MSLIISATSGMPFPSVSGYPAPFAGLLIPGANATTYVNEQGSFTVQEMAYPLFTIRLHTYYVEGHTTIHQQREEEGLNTIAVISRKYRHTISGQGRFVVNHGFFSSVFYHLFFQPVMRRNNN